MFPMVLPHALKFNLAAARERNATNELAMGVEPGAESIETAGRRIVAIRKLAGKWGIAMRACYLHVPETALLEMADSVIKVSRLLNNNLRVPTFEDAVAIYRNAYAYPGGSITGELTVSWGLATTSYFIAQSIILNGASKFDFAIRPALLCDAMDRREEAKKQWPSNYRAEVSACGRKRLPGGPVGP